MGRLCMAEFLSEMGLGWPKNQSPSGNDLATQRQSHIFETHAVLQFGM